MSAPGSILYRLAIRLSDEMTFTRVLDAWLADFRFEYATADHWSKRVWLRLAYTSAWMRAVGQVGLSGDDVSRALAYQAIGIVVIAFILVAPFWVALADDGPERRPYLGLLLVPQALVVALTLGSAWGAVFSIRRLTKASRATVVCVALLCSAMTAVMLQWVSPVTNQAYREAYIQRPLRRGLAEMSLTQLATEVKRTGGDEWRNLALRQLHMNLAVTVAPVVLTVFVVTVAARTRWPRTSGAVAVVAYYVCISFQRQMVRPPDSEAWMLTVIWGPTLLLLALTSVFRGSQSAIA